MPAILDKILRIGEGKILRQLEAHLQGCQCHRGRLQGDERRRAPRPDRGVQGAAGEGRVARRHHAGGVRHRPRGVARVTGMRPFDVQIMGAAALHLGNIAEMKTGEGKTLVATLPSYLNALAGKGVHIVTVNDYLAKYQSEMDGPHPPLPRARRRRDPAGDAARRSAARPTPATSPTAPTTSSASTTSATTWPARSRTASSAATPSRSSTRSTRSSSTRPAPR